MKNVASIYSEYCCGCGLCKAVGLSEMEMSEEGFCIATGSGKKFDDFCKQVCPVSAVQMIDYDKKSVWGKQTGVYIGFATDKLVRYKASSGGVLTALCLYLIDNRLVDGIIHTVEDLQDPISTRTVCSTSVEEIIERCGSRYSSSTPLTDINDFFVDDKTYAYIGKPCDIVALNNFAKLDERVDKHIRYKFSFFCAGVPSEKANIRLLKKLGIEREACVSLTYRGNGWPGLTMAIDKNGQKYATHYENAWGEILGRDIRKICRFCIDGIGEAADIACADAWYLEDNDEPSFVEADGRNAVFCRNEKGKELLHLAIEAGYIDCIEYLDWRREIDCYQKYQLQRRTTMGTTLFAMKTMGKQVPKYKKSILKMYAKEISFSIRIRRYIGTIKRIIQGKIC